jgi:hypothetical protein
MLNNMATAPGSITIVCLYIRHVNGWSEAGRLTKNILDAKATYMLTSSFLSFLSQNQLKRAVLPGLHIGLAIICVSSIVSFMEFKSIFASVSIGYFFVSAV